MNEQTRLARVTHGPGRTAALAALLAAILLIALTTTGRMGAADPIRVDLAAAEVAFAPAEALPEGIRLRLSDRGAALLRIPVAVPELSAYPMLQLTLARAPDNARVVVFGRGVENPAERSLGTLTLDGAGTLNPYFGSRPSWSGELSELLLGFEGPPGAEIELQSVILMSPGALAVVRNLRQTWVTARPWLQNAVNIAGGQSEAAYLQPGLALSLVAVLAAVLALILGSYRGARRGAPAAAGAAFLIVWLVADLLWLPQPLFATQQALETFRGKSDERRLLAGPDARRVLLSRRVDLALQGQADVRIFVASAEDFRGMRSAYYLYPRNVYWHRDHELPPAEFFRSGDHILLLAPTQHWLRDGRLGSRDPAFGELSVSTVFVDRAATFLRVN